MGDRPAIGYPWKNESSLTGIAEPQDKDRGSCFWEAWRVVLHDG